jgi:hypothetical protein
VVSRLIIGFSAERLIDRLKNISGGVIWPAGKIKEKFNAKPIKRLLQDTLGCPFLGSAEYGNKDVLIGVDCTDNERAFLLRCNGYVRTVV